MRKPRVDRREHHGAQPRCTRGSAAEAGQRGDGEDSPSPQWLCGTKGLPVARSYTTFRASERAPAVGTTDNLDLGCGLLPAVGCQLIT